MAPTTTVTPPRRSIGNWLRFRQSSARIRADQTDGRGPDSDCEPEADPSNERAADESGMSAAEYEARPPRDSRPWRSMRPTTTETRRRPREREVGRDLHVGQVPREEGAQRPRPPLTKAQEGARPPPNPGRRPRFRRGSCPAGETVGSRRRRRTDRPAGRSRYRCRCRTPTTAQGHRRGRTRGPSVRSGSCARASVWCPSPTSRCPSGRCQRTVRAHSLVGPP